MPSLVGSEMCIRDRRRGLGLFHRHGHCRRLQRPTSMDFYGFNSAPTVRKNHTTTGSYSGRRNIAIPDQLSRLIGPSAFTSAPITPPRMPRRHRLGLGAPYRTLSRPPLAFPSDLSWRPYTIRSPNDPGPIKSIVQPARCTPSRYASYGSASLQRQQTGSLAHSIIEFSPPPVFLSPVAAVENSLQQPRVRVQFWVLIIFSSVTIF